jgi:hypothetical protein
MGSIGRTLNLHRPVMAVKAAMAQQKRLRVLAAMR